MKLFEKKIKPFYLNNYINNQIFFDLFKMAEVINASSNISSLLLMKHNDLFLKSQQSHSKAIEEIANQMNIEFVNFNEFSDIYEFRSDLYGDNVRKASWSKKSRHVILRSVPGYSIEDHHKKLTEEVTNFLNEFEYIIH